jgi:hypothetical protein
VEELLSGPLSIRSFMRLNIITLYQSRFNLAETELCLFEVFVGEIVVSVSPPIMNWLYSGRAKRSRGSYNQSCLRRYLQAICLE